MRDGLVLPDLEWGLYPLNTMVQSFTVNCWHTADMFFRFHLFMLFFAIPLKSHRVPGPVGNTFWDITIPDFWYNFTWYILEIWLFLWACLCCMDIRRKEEVDGFRALEGRSSSYQEVGFVRTEAAPPEQCCWQGQYPMAFEVMLVVEAAVEFTLSLNWEWSSSAACSDNVDQG